MDQTSATPQRLSHTVHLLSRTSIVISMPHGTRCTQYLTRPHAKTRSAAVAEKSCAASCHDWIFRLLAQDHSRSLEMAPRDRSHTSSCRRSTATMALSCIISEIKRDIPCKSRFFHTPVYRNIAKVWYRTIRMVWLSDGDQRLYSCWYKGTLDRSHTSSCHSK